MFKYLAIATSLTFFALSSAIAQPGHAILVKPEKIGHFEFYNKFTAISRCGFETSRDYYAKVAGTVDKVSVIQGAYVTEGSEMIVIDQDLAEATRLQGEAEFKFAEATYNKDASLLNKKIISKEALSKSKVALEQARIELVKSINTYEDMVIKAPFNGYVGVIKANPGDEIKVGDYLFSFIANGDKILFLELPENLLGKIDENTIINVKDTDNKDVTGKILASTDYVSNTGTVTVKAIFPKETKLVHGSFISADLIYGKHKGLAIPEKAILKNDQGNFVYKITEGNLVKQVYITPGVRTGEMIELLSGDIAENDMVVIDGLTKVQDDVVVELIKE
jgi:membrane fusion protein (multidrug efflux system)